MDYFSYIYDWKSNTSTKIGYLLPVVALNRNEVLCVTDGLGVSKLFTLNLTDHRRKVVNKSIPAWVLSGIDPGSAAFWIGQ